MAGKLVLCRHGQSDWNLRNLFTGWKDVDLTEKGNAEAIAAGELLRDLGYDFDIAYTSVLKSQPPTLAADREAAWTRKNSLACCIPASAA